MRIKLRKPLGVALVALWGDERLLWEQSMSRELGFSVSLPQFFWEVDLLLIHNRFPGHITIQCSPGHGWMSVFYSYNLQGDLSRYIESSLLRYCKRMLKSDRVYQRDG